MTAGPVVRRLAAAGEAAAAAAVDRAQAALAARVGEVLPGMTVEIGAGAVRLRGRGLLVRAFGSRRQAADPRLAALVRGDGQ